MKQLANTTPYPSKTATVIRGGFQSLIGSDLPPERISISFRPMDHLHAYQVFSLSNALAYLLKNPHAKLRIDLADLEFDTQRGRSFLPYSKSPDSKRTIFEIALLLESVKSNVSGLGGRISTMHFSHALREDERFRSYVTGMFTRSRLKAFKKLISSSTKITNIPFVPICPACDHASSEFGRLSLEAQTLSGICRNYDCTKSGQIFSVSLSDPTGFCFHYFLDSMADGYKDPRTGERTDLHMLGINPDWEWGSRKIALVDIIATVTSLATEDGYSPLYYPVRRFEEKDTSLTQRLRWSDYLERRQISAIDAVLSFIAEAERFDGLTHYPVECAF